jgi:hypothetical protein
VAWATERPLFKRQITVGSSYPAIPTIYNAGVEPQTLGCGCRVEASRDFLGRVVGTIVEKGAQCPRVDHEPGRTVIMPGRENARPE